MPPPQSAELPEMMELETVNLPELLKAPPSPVIFTPETVAPEIARLPPVAMLKTLKFLLVLIVPEELSKPLMISEEAPMPVIVRVPTVPPVIAVLTFKIVGNAEAKVMV